MHTFQNISKVHLDVTMGFKDKSQRHCKQKERHNSFSSRPVEVRDFRHRQKYAKDEALEAQHKKQPHLFLNFRLNEQENFTL